MLFSSDALTQAEEALIARNRLAADAAELARWKGNHLLPRAGCRLIDLPFGASSVTAEIEVLDDRVNVLEILVNGRMVNAEDWVHPSARENWESFLWEEEKRAGELKVAA